MLEDTPLAVMQHRITSAVPLQVDDVLHTALTERFDFVTDKGTLDAIGLSANAANDRRGLALFGGCCRPKTV